MEKFNKKRALNGEPVITRNGDLVTDLKFNKNCSYPFSCILFGKYFCWNKQGKYHEMIDSSFDLFMK